MPKLSISEGPKTDFWEVQKSSFRTPQNPFFAFSQRNMAFPNSLLARGKVVKNSFSPVFVRFSIKTQFSGFWGVPKKWHFGGPKTHFFEVSETHFFDNFSIQTNCNHVIAIPTIAFLQLIVQKLVYTNFLRHIFWSINRNRTKIEILVLYWIAIWQSNIGYSNVWL